MSSCFTNLTCCLTVILRTGPFWTEYHSMFLQGIVWLLSAQVGAVIVPIQIWIWVLSSSAPCYMDELTILTCLSFLSLEFVSMHRSIVRSEIGAMFWLCTSVLGNCTGKSTILRLLYRFFDCDSGSVSFLAFLKSNCNIGVLHRNIWCSLACQALRST